MLGTIRNGLRCAVSCAKERDVLTVIIANGSAYLMPVSEIEFDNPNGADLIRKANRRYETTPFPMCGQMWPVPAERENVWIRALNAVVAEAEKEAALEARVQQQIATDKLSASIRRAEYDARFQTNESRSTRKRAVLAELALLPFSDAPTASREAALTQELEWLSDVVEQPQKASLGAMADLVTVISTLAGAA